MFFDKQICFVYLYMKCDIMSINIKAGVPVAMITSTIQEKSYKDLHNARKFKF